MLPTASAHGATGTINARDIEFADVLLPAQFYIRSHQDTPWQLLAAATLRQAVADYAKSAKQPRWRREMIRSWIADDRDHARSFVNLCALLELDPSYLRSHPRAMLNRIDRGDGVKVCGQCFAKCDLSRKSDRAP